jgi:hypothetical protein
MKVVSDVQRAWNEGGTKAVLTRSLKKLVSPAFTFGSLVFIECDLRKPMPERRATPGVTVHEATLDDVNLFEDRNVFTERLREGHRCFMGIEDATGKLTNYRWVSTTPTYIPELQRHLMLKPGEVYVYDLRTMPGFRRRGIDAYTRHCIYSGLKDAGYTKVLAYIHGDNRPSLKASKILLTPVGRVWYLQLRGCEPIMFGGNKPGFPELRKLRSSVHVAKDV